MYLGLLLVGGTPCVLAQDAATTKSFVLKDEIEVKDDLDKDPDPASLALSIKVYFEDVNFFLGGLQQLGRRGSFDHTSDRFEVSQDTLLPCVAGNKVGSYTARSFDSANTNIRPLLERFGKLLNDGYSLADCLPSTRFGNDEAADSRFVVRFDQNELSVEVAVKKRSANYASRFLGHLDRAVQLFKEQHKDLNRDAIFDATQVRSRDDQVFIVTRLPRAGLETLLAKDAK